MSRIQKIAIVAGLALAIFWLRPVAAADWVSEGTVWSRQDGSGVESIQDTMSVSWVPTLSADTSRESFYFSDAVKATCAALDCTSFGDVGTCIPMVTDSENIALQSVNGSSASAQLMTAVGNPNSFMVLGGQFSGSVPSTAPTSTRIKIGCGCEGTGAFDGYLVNVSTPQWSDRYFGTTSTWYPDFGSQLVANLQPFSSSTETGYDLPTAAAFCLSTSTETGFSAIGQGIKESFCTLAFKLFVPSDAALQSVTNQREVLFTQFPLNVFNTLVGDLTVGTVSSTLTTTSTNLTLNFGSRATSSFGTFMPTSTEILSPHMYQTWVPAWIRTLFRLMFTIGLWWGCLFAIYKLGRKLFHPSHEK